MRPRFAADYRTLLWVFFAAALVALEFARPALAPYLFWVNAYLALACGVIAHNHNHCPTFADKRANQAFGDGDLHLLRLPDLRLDPDAQPEPSQVRQSRRRRDDHLALHEQAQHLVAASYFFVSSYYQGYPISAFIQKAREQNPAALPSDPHAVRVLERQPRWPLLGLALALHGLRQGLVLYVLACGIPAFFALWTIMLFNYEQHVHTDPWSEHNHSRSWDGKLVNFFLFNNGLHAAHHENPGTHWSKLPELHAELAPKIDQRLIERNMWWYFAKNYLVAPLFPKFGSVQVGRAPFDPPDGKLDVVTSAEVELGEAGTNASFVGSS